MAEYHRAYGLIGETVTLRSIFADDMGNLITPDDTVNVYIYDAEIDTEIMSAEIEAGTFDSAISGPIEATEISTGFYAVEYDIPEGSTGGTWYDVWVTTINGTEYKQELMFEVDESVNISEQKINNNTMIIIELSDKITNLDGDSFLESIKLFYTTTYDPFYSSPDLVRIEVGPWIDYISDDTIALLIHWSSKEAKMIQNPITSTAKRGEYIKFARNRFVTYDVALKTLLLPGGGNVAGYNSGGSKKLGDLEIAGGTTNVSVDKNILEELRNQRKEWWRVVNSGGEIVPGQSLSPTFGIKGLYDPDRRNIGRLWESPNDSNYPVPTVNEKVVTSPMTKARWRFKDKGRSR